MSLAWCRAHHLNASVRTPFAQYPCELPIFLYGEGPGGFHEESSDILEKIIDHYYFYTDQPPGEDWFPEVYLFAGKPITGEFIELEWVTHIRESLRENSLYGPKECAQSILEGLEEQAYEDWDSEQYLDDLTRLLDPVFTYLKLHGEFFNLWEAVRLLLPVKHDIEDWDLGVTEDTDHAIDLSLDDVRKGLEDYNEQRKCYNNQRA